MNPLLDMALHYASSGWLVFPCIPNGKRPLVENGFLDATTDPVTIKDWWDSYPEANIGVATGSPGPDVLDIDVKAGTSGYDSLARLRERGLVQGAFAAVTTPSGGAHFYYPGTRQRCRTMARAGIDFRSTGGYVVVPPSMIDGVAYTLKEETDRGVKPLDFDKIHDFLEPPRRVVRQSVSTDGDVGALSMFVLSLIEGERNRGLYWAACRALDSEYDLEPLRDAASLIGLDDREITATFRSAERRGPRGR